MEIVKKLLIIFSFLVISTTSFALTTAELTNIVDSLMARKVHIYTTNDSSFGYANNYTKWFNTKTDTLYYVLRVENIDTNGIRNISFFTDALDARVISANALTSSEIADAALPGSKFPANTWTSSHFTDGLFTSVKFPANVWTSSHYTNGLFTSEKFPANVWTTSHYTDGLFTGIKFGANFLDASKIATDAIDADAVSATAADEIVDSLFGRMPADTVTNTFMATMYRTIVSVIPAELDSIAWVTGNKINGYSTSYRSADTDTLRVYIGATMLFKKVYYHTGGSPAGAPDSVKVVAP